MNLDVLFTLELLGALVLIILVVAGAIYVVVSNRRGGRAPESEGPPPRLTDAATPRREFYKSLGLETDEDMKVRLYSLEEYESELGGDAGAVRSGRFVGALKAYRLLDDEWYDYSPNKAADALELAPEDYEVDNEHSALLLKRLPPGMPVSARDAL